MNTIELFSGTKSFSKVAEKLGYSTLTIDNDKSLNPDICMDIREVFNSDNIMKTLMNQFIDFVWASPPCQGFSVAAIGKNWNHDRTPKTDSAKLSLELVKQTVHIIDSLHLQYWFIENPRGMLRKIEWFEDWVKRNGGVRHTVSYCQYGDTRQKPTDIWTNCKEWQPKPICKPGASCHESAPRGSRTGTQGIKGARDRGVIPPALFEEIFNAIKVGH